MTPHKLTLSPPPSGMATSIGEGVTTQIRRWILSGELKPGSRLVLRELSDQLGVSPMPVREALIALATEGLIVGKPNRGFRVVQLTKTDVQDVFAIYSHIACLVTERVATDRPPELVPQIRSIQDKIVETAQLPDSAEAVEVLNHEFHRTINTSIPADRLRLFLRMAARHVPRHFYVVPGWIDITLDDHPPMIEAIAAGDSVRARDLMASHLDKTGEMLVEALEQRGYWQPERD